MLQSETPRWDEADTPGELRRAYDLDVLGGDPAANGGKRRRRRSLYCTL